MRRILIIGSGGRLGSALFAGYRDTFDVTGFSHSEIDLSDFDETEELVRRAYFDVLINCSAMTNVDMCEEQPDEAFRVNAGAPDVLAEICQEKNARLIHFSTDYVFDGQKRNPYTEEDEPNPISVYGESKREGEEAVLAANEGNLVVRVSWVFGPERPSFVDNMIQRARESVTVSAVADKFSTPTYTRDVVNMLRPFLAAESNARGIVHIANAGECSWHQYAQHALNCCREGGVPLKTFDVAEAHLSDMKTWVAQRPVFSVLSTAKFEALAGTAPRPWPDVVSEYIREFVAKPCSRGR